MLLWLLPPLALAGGGIALWIHGRRRSGAAMAEAAVSLTPEEESRLASLIADEASPEKQVLTRGITGAAGNATELQYRSRRR